MLTVNQLNKKIGNRQVLKDVNFQLHRGEVGILLGGSGVGKSTLLRILNNLENYDKGEFSLDEKALDLTTVNKNHRVGMVFQHFNLFEHLTVLENITLALTHLLGKNKNDANEIAINLLKRYGLHDKQNENVHRLSGGQKQRLAIARTMALNPQVICLDEPTSALDPQLTHQVANYIKEMATDNRIVLVATHDMNLASKLHGTIFLMEHGCIVETTSTKDYNENPNHYSLIQRFINP